MVCKLLERAEVPPSPRRAFDGVVDEGDRRWRFKAGLLTHYIRYVPDKLQRPGVLPWCELWSADDARR
jgi:hypothetical protein